MESIIGSCLESKQDRLIGHVLDECKLVTRILEAEKNSALSTNLTKVKKFASEYPLFTYDLKKGRTQCRRLPHCAGSGGGY